MIRIQALPPNHQHTLSDQAEVAAQINIGPVRVLCVSEGKVIPSRARIDGVSGQQRIDPRIERNVAAEANKAIREATERDVLPVANRPKAHAAGNVAIAPDPHAGTSVVLTKKRILAASNPGARLDPAQSKVDWPIEFDAAAFVASPRCGKRDPAPLSGNIGKGGASAIRKAVSLLELENGHEHETQTPALTQSRNPCWCV